MSFSDIILVFVFINIVIVLLLILILNYRKVIITQIKDFHKIHLQGNSKNHFSRQLPPPLPPPLPIVAPVRTTGTSLNTSKAINGKPSTPVSRDKSPSLDSFQALRPPPIVVTSTQEQKNKQNLLLLDSTIITASLYQDQFSGFPRKRFSEWYSVRKCDDSPTIDDLISKAELVLANVSFNYDEVVLRFSLTATYSQKSDLIYFCATSYNTRDVNAPALRMKLLILSQNWGLMFHELLLDVTGQEAEEITRLESRLEVNEIPTMAGRVAHLRRMHAYFDERLKTYVSFGLMDRRTDMISTYNVIIEEHERLLEVYGFSP
jgi:hypothetical protein